MMKDCNGFLEGVAVIFRHERSLFRAQDRQSLQMKEKSQDLNKSVHISIIDGEHVILFDGNVIILVYSTKMLQEKDKYTKIKPPISSDEHQSNDNCIFKIQKYSYPIDASIF